VFFEILRALKVADKKPLTITGAYNKTLYLSCRNLEKAAIAPAQDLNTYQILNAGALVIAESAIEKIKENCA
jgi:large subunit ribosomal protein L4